MDIVINNQYILEYIFSFIPINLYPILVFVCRRWSQISMKSQSRTFRKQIDNMLFLARNGYLECMKFYHSILQYPLVWIICNSACEGGHLECLQYVCENNSFPKETSTCSCSGTAASG